MKKTDLLEKLKKDQKHIILYGAGMVGGLVFELLLAGGIERNRIFFAVSDVNGCSDTYRGQHIFGIREVFRVFEGVHVLITTLPDAHRDMEENLQECKCYDYDVIDEDLFAEMEKEYVTGYIQEHPLKETAYDILFMPSDNNASSGAFLSMIDLVCEIIHQGISVLIVLPSYGTGYELLIEKKLDFTYVLSKDWLIELKNGKKKDLKNNINSVVEIRSLIRKHHIKLVHLNTTYTYVGALAAEKENVPVVWHLREFIKEQGYWFLDEDKAFQLINNSDAVIVPSDYLRECYPRLKKDIVHRIYDGVDTEKFYCENHTLMKEDKIKILMPGRISPLKGQKQLLDAAVRLKQRGYGFEIIFVGGSDPVYFREVQALAEKNGLNENVVFQEQSRVMDHWYSEADVVVVCSRSEAFGRVAVEAQLAGCLVIGADKGATKEIIKDGETGVLYKYEDGNDLALCIENAWNNKDRFRRVAKTGQMTAVELFKQSVCAGKIVDIYRRIVGECF